MAWAPSAGKMQCPFCDSLVEVPREEEFEAVEHDLMAFLEAHPTADGYGVEMEAFSCRSCGAEVSAPPGRRDLTCAFCGSEYVLESEGGRGEVVQPESLIPFSISRNDCGGLFRTWIGAGWFRPNDLKKMGKLDRIQGIYMPFFTFDAQAESDWTAEAGFYYYVTKRVPVRENGRTVYRNKRVRKIRWEPRSGRRSDFYDDVLVPAVTPEHLDLLLRVYPYELGALAPYDSRFLAGFGVLNSELSLQKVYGVAKSNIEGDQVSRCAGDIPGDTYRNLRVDTLLGKQTFKHLLCPLWLGSFRYRRKVFPFVVNGQTGKLFGRKPWSWIKITLFSLALLAGGAAAYFIFVHNG